ncbi:hypothetical protein TNCV_1891101 [Trichonephila clavipes]|nr:hypothetical protein TNCV_1891101 [Trichonephila clavipes]
MISPDLDANQKRMLVDVLQEYSEAFKETKNGTPQITVKHRINTGDNLPVKQSVSCVPSRGRIIRYEVGKMLRQWNHTAFGESMVSPVILVRKKDNTRRLHQ